MARTLDGDIANYISVATSYLSASTAFTVFIGYIKPADLAQAEGWPVVVGNVAGNRWGVAWEATADSVSFLSSGHTGTSPVTSSAIALDATDVSNGCAVAWRYDGTTWTKWKATGRGGSATVTRTVISSSITFGLATLSTSSTIISPTVKPWAGDIGEIAFMSVALTDDQMQALMRGVTADQIVGAGALLAYWPIRGNNSPEPDYVSLPAFPGTNKLTITGTCAQAFPTHPATYGLDDLRSPNQLHAWVYTVSQSGETIRVGTADLSELQDMDVIGGPVLGCITNPDDIDVARSIENSIGTAVSPSTVILATDVDSPPGLRPGLCTTYATAVALDKPTAFWRCSDPATTASGVTNTSVIDSTRNRIHAAVTGAVTYQATGPLTGDLTKAITNNGTSSNYATTPAGVSALNLTKAVSVECWAKFAASSGSYGIVEYTTAVGTSNKQYLIFTSGSTIYARVVVGAANKDATYATGGFNTSNWYHIVLTYDGSNVRLYVDGTLRATTAASGGLDSNATGLAILGRLGDSSYVLNGSMSCVAIYDYALNQTQITRHYTIGTSGAREWRGASFTLHRYERSSHELVPEIAGVIVDSDFSIPGRVTLHNMDRNDALLDTLVPTRLVNVDEHETATDVGAPIPVAFGRGAVSAPAIAYDDDADFDAGGGQDFVVSALKDASNATMTVRPRVVWYDNDGAPGMEKAGEFYGAPGTITRVSDTVFGYGGAHQDRYEAYMSVRVTTDSGVTWSYSHITSIDTGTNRATIADAIITTGWDEIQINGEYVLDYSTYTSHSKPLLTVRVLGDVSSGVVVEVENSSITNPADVVEELLTNAEWSIGASVNAGSFAQAVTDFTSAGLSTACNYVLGGDRQQRALRTVLAEVLSIRGAWITTDPDTGTWAIYVDKAGATPWRSLGYIDGYLNNIKTLAYERQTTLDDAVSSLNLRYALARRTYTTHGGNSADLDFNRYSKSVFAAVLALGTTLVVPNPWIRQHADAARVVSYNAKRLAAEDRQKGCVLGVCGRNIQLGELVNLKLGHNGDEGIYRVRGYRRSLTETVVDLVGYDSAMFTLGTVTYEDGASGTNTQANLESERIKTTPIPGIPPNWVRGADFGYGVIRAQRAGYVDAGAIPGWRVLDESPSIVTFTVTNDKETIGGAYLTATYAGSGIFSLETNASVGARLNRLAMPAGETDRVLFSWYADSKPALWYFGFLFYGANGGSLDSAFPTIRETGETNYKGWKRYYISARAPADTGYVSGYIVTDDTAASATVKFDAFKLELGAAGQTRPSQWTAGIDNTLMLVNEESVTLSGATTDSSSTQKILEAGYTIANVDYIVTTAVSGSCTSWSLGPKSGTANVYANTIAKTVNTTGNAIVNGNGFTPGTGIAADNQVTFTANGGTFSGGVVKVRVHYYRASTPIA